MNENNFVENIYTVARHKHIKIGDMETALEFSVGYTARIRNNCTISLENAIKYCDFLGEDVGRMVNENYDLLYRREELQQQIAELEEKLKEMM